MKIALALIQLNSLSAQQNSDCRACPISASMSFTNCHTFYFFFPSSLSSFFIHLTSSYFSCDFLIYSFRDCASHCLSVTQYKKNKHTYIHTIEKHISIWHSFSNHFFYLPLIQPAMPIHKCQRRQIVSLHICLVPLFHVFASKTNYKKKTKEKQ